MKCRWCLAVPLALLLSIGFVPRQAAAHEMSMAEMEVRELSRGEFIWQWSATNDKRPGTEGLQPQWPAQCVADTNALHCGDRGLSGTLAIEGVGRRYSAALVKIYWLSGESQVYTFTNAQKHARLFGAAEDGRGLLEIASAYSVLGVEHILGGYDHQLFVFGLLFLVGFRRKLVWTITAFTAAHSITLASAALGLLTLRSPPVEASIALSIVLVAMEALQSGDTLARRLPALVAFLFGLVHGLGFAGALQDIGLPQKHLPMALLTFNVGVELGQLLIVGVALVLWRSLASWRQFTAARVPALYAIGAIGSYWSIARIAGIFQGAW
jgi:hydrogenase/urease accessory protein HupE